MKKLFLIILLLALPMQISWAAMGAYCQHESGKSAHHFGHHSHQHKVEKDGNKKEGSLAKVDRDCVYCYLSHVSVFSFAADPLPKSSHDSHLTNYDYHIALIHPTRPERPKWAFAA